MGDLGVVGDGREEPFCRKVGIFSNSDQLKWKCSFVTFYLNNIITMQCLEGTQGQHH